ncbi:hypothetical protein ACVWYF_004536 [Hymenobacter sp. UYAg731]
MISPFLTAPERQGYQQVPAVLSETDLRQYFHLTGADREFIQRQRRDGNRLGKYTLPSQVEVQPNGLRNRRKPPERA